MKGFAKFLIRWIAAYIFGAGLAVLIFGLSIKYFEDNTPVLVILCIIGLIVWMSWTRFVVGIVNRFLEKW
ncbi:MAG: hypothetical protein JW762_04450 [Dehalococcoidales bacterium]|nr:hypothetical protein [Dehalococcoidales bacterium]